MFLILQFTDEHNSYWSQFPGKYEHWRFSDGFIQGWDDAYKFFTFSQDMERPVSELGFVVTLRKKRSAEHIVQKGAGNNIWEYGLFFDFPFRLELRSAYCEIEHGFSQGADMAKKDFQQCYCCQ